MRSPPTLNLNSESRTQRLPAAAATAATIAAVPTTTPASIATAASIAAAAGTTAAATAGTTAATAAKAATTSTPSSAASATTAFARRTRFVNDDVTAHEILAVQTLNSTVCFFIVCYLDESETARLTRKTVANQRHIRRSDSRRGK
jgi:hypothetical protein